MAEPLLVLEGIRREFPAGDGTIAVLNNIHLSIDAGDMVAIVGASGSGKSTLMNILGCLDQPSSGNYRIAGRQVSTLDAEELAALRRDHFGFVFQRYHLLGDLDALGNVEIPAIYAGKAAQDRRTRAAKMLERLGMADRMMHRPGQLSGGQQQRVSIARALMNGATVILADEPTGALDKQSGEDVLRILEELNGEGNTIIIVTHDMTVARRARRIVEISDGEIVSDRRNPTAAGHALASVPTATTVSLGPSPIAHLGRFVDSLRMAFLAMKAHRLRTFLTMLGIIIGIASVVSVVALGQGSRQRVLANISSLGTNTLEVFAGRDFGDTRSDKITTLVPSDADALASQSYVEAVTPTVSTSSTVRFASKEASALVNGVSDRYFDAKGAQLLQGRLFDADSVRAMAQDVVIDTNTRSTLFAPGVDPLGQAILIGRIPARVVGVIGQQQGGFGSSQNLSIYLPYTTVQTRLLGSRSLRSIIVRISDGFDTSLAEDAVTRLLMQRHGTRDFFILNTDDIRRTITATTETMTLLIAAIAVISLLVGGIGVMNIMLVSVSERVAEIGVRMAVGARRADILQQFLIEAVLVCLVGGALGVATALSFGMVFALIGGSALAFLYSPTPVLAALICCTLIGLIFGYLPARNAARLDPVAALARE